MQKSHFSTNVMKQHPSEHTRSLFFSLFFFSFSPVPFAPWCIAFSLQWLFQSAARDVINFIHALWMLCLEKKKKDDGEEMMWGESEEEKESTQGEREVGGKRERRYGVAEEDFQCSCMYNEWGGTLFETPARRSTSRFAGQSGGPVISRRPPFLSCQ